MKTYVLMNRKNQNDVITIHIKDLTPEQMKEIWRNGYKIMAIK